MSASVEHWTSVDVSTWLTRIGLGKYAELFVKHEINGEILLTMNESDLSSSPLNFDTFGAIRKFGIEIEILKKMKNPPIPKIETVQSIFSETNCTAKIQRVGTNGHLPIEPPAAALEPEIGQDCRDAVVAVNGIVRDHASEMEHLFNNFTWRYESNLDMIQQLNKDGVQVEVVVDVSPAEFYIQTSYAGAKAQRLLSEMNAFYTEGMEPVPLERIYENMPCAVMFGEEWFRAIVQEKGLDDARVVFVDWGNSQFTNYADIKALTTDFGQYPPLAIRCRIDKVRDRTLTIKVVNDFLAEIENLNMLVKIVPMSINEDKGGINVRLLNPQTNEDIGAKYLPKNPCIPEDDDDLDDLEEKLELRNISESFREEEKKSPVRVAEFDRLNPMIVEQVKLKAEKLDKGLYTSNIEAFLDGAPGFDEVDSDDEDYKPRNSKKKSQPSSSKRKPQSTPKAAKVFTDAQRVAPKNILPAEATINEPKESPRATTTAKALPRHTPQQATAKSVRTPIENEMSPYTRFLHSSGVEYITRLEYPKQAPPPLGQDLTVFLVKVVTAREIYFRTEMQKNCLITLQKVLQNLQDDVDTIPLSENLFKSGVSCAYKDVDGRWYRAMIRDVDQRNDEKLTLILIDYVRIIVVDRSDRCRIKALRAHALILMEAQVYKCKIFKICDPPLTDVESELLKEILIENEKLTARFELEREPYRVHLKYGSTSKDFNELFEKEMSDRNLEQIAACQRYSRFDFNNACREPLKTLGDAERVTVGGVRTDVRQDRVNIVGAANSFGICTKSFSLPATSIFTVIKTLPSPPLPSSKPSVSGDSHLANVSFVPLPPTIDDDAELDEGPDVVIIDEDTD